MKSFKQTPVSAVQAWLFQTFNWYRRRYSKRVCIVCLSPATATRERGKDGENLSGPEAIHVFYVCAEIWRTNPDPVRRLEEPYVWSKEQATIAVRACSECRGWLNEPISKRPADASRRRVVRVDIKELNQRGGKFLVQFIGPTNEVVNRPPSETLAIHLVREFLPSMPGLEIRRRLLLGPQSSEQKTEET
ncbi:MAG: hypothetical protein PHR51_01265 [Patescibacteria group bacterium]|nr:hypothetical protein [Patescibacteria group bacterium]